MFLSAYFTTLFVFILQLEMSFSEKVSDDTVLDMRRRLEDQLTENRVLKSDVTDAQTNQAILRSELASLRQQYEDKCRELKKWVNPAIHVSLYKNNVI